MAANIGQPAGGGGGGGPPGPQLAGSGSGAVNIVNLTTEALVTGSTTVGGITSGGDIDVIAVDDSFITGDAGGLALSFSKQGNTQVAFGVSLAINEVTSTVTASIAGTTARAIPITATGSVTVKTTATPTIKAFTIAGAIAAGTGGNNASTQLTLTGAGAGSKNTIGGSNTASISAGTVVAGGAVTVSANDTSYVQADAGGFAIALVKSTSGNFFSLALGLSVAINSITRTLDASIDPSSVTAAGTGGVVVEAINSATISALSMGGAASSDAGSGAGSQNTIDIDISAGITAPGGRTTVSATGGPVRVEARDTSSITADAGGVSVAVAIGKDPGDVNLTGAIAASVAINRITNTVAALVDRADITAVTAAGDLSVLATSNATINALTLSGSAAIQKVDNNGQGDSLSLTLAGAGAGSGNSLDDTVTAIVTDSTLSSGGNVLVQAQRPAAADGSPTIKAEAYGVTFALALGTQDALTASVGAAVSVNAIGRNGGDTVRAAVERSTITAGGSVTVGAESDPSISAIGVGATVGVSVPADSETAVTIGLGGAVTLNSIGSTVDAHVTDSTICAGSSAGTCTAAVAVTAAQTGGITAICVAANVTGTLAKGATVSLAAAVATNTLTSTISATVSGSTTSIRGERRDGAGNGRQHHPATTVAVTASFH